MFHQQFFYDTFNKHNIIDINSIDKFKICSLVIKKDTRIKNLINFIEKYKNKDVCLVLMFHSIVKKPKNKWEYQEKDFEKLVQYLSQNVSVKTLKEIIEKNYEQ